MQYIKVKSIKRISKRDRYDLTIPKTHNFFANGILIHNTSGRTGLIPVKQDLTGWKKFWNKRMAWTGLSYPTSQYEYVTGTRKVVLDQDATADTGFYSGKTFRVDIHNRIKQLTLYKGETLYYEIVGYAEDGSKIMPSHEIKDKKLKKLYGKNITYSYGCEPAHYKVMIYRITQANEDDKVTELSWPQVKHRCGQLGLETVPELDAQFYNGNAEALLEYCKELSDGHSTLDTSHIKEGVAIRVEDQHLFTTFKYKSYDFCMLEGIQPNYVDPEAMETYVEDET